MPLVKNSILYISVPFWQLAGCWMHGKCSRKPFFPQLIVGLWRKSHNLKKYILHKDWCGVYQNLLIPWRAKIWTDDRVAEGTGFWICYSVQDASEAKHQGQKTFIATMLQDTIILPLKSASSLVLCACYYMNTVFGQLRRKERVFFALRGKHSFFRITGSITRTT